MIYTQHLSKLLQSSGVPHFSIKGFQTIMNIVHLEAKIQELSNLEQTKKNLPMVGLFTFEKNNHTRTLKSLTQDKQPMELMRELCNE